MKEISFGKNNKYRAAVYRKSEVNSKITRTFVDAGFNAREGTIEQNYLILLSELNDINPNKNPYFNASGNGKTTDAYFVIVFENEKPVGRSIVLYDPLYNDTHLKYNREPVVWLGWPEFKNNEVGEKLLEIVHEYAKKIKKKDNSLKYVIGPGRPNEQGIVGLRTAGKFAFFMEPDNPIWYKNVFEKNGITVDNYWTALRFTEKNVEEWKKLLDMSKSFFKRSSNGNTEVIRLSKFSLSKHLNGIYDVYKEAWDSEEHIHGRALTKKEFDYMASGIKIMVPPYWNNVYIAREKARNKTLGISISLPNFNETLEKLKSKTSGERIRKEILFILKNFIGMQRYKSGRIFIAGVIPEVKGLKRSVISSKLIAESIYNFQKSGINDISMSQLAVPNKDVVIPLLVAHGADKKLLSDYDKNVIPIIEKLSEEGKASLATVYRFPI